MSFYYVKPTFTAARSLLNSAKKNLGIMIKVDIESLTLARSNFHMFVSNKYVAMPFFR
jgi:hypothetical protein